MVPGQTFTGTAKNKKPFESEERSFSRGKRGVERRLTPKVFILGVLVTSTEHCGMEMTTASVGASVILAFMLGLWFARLVPTARRAIEIARVAHDVMNDAAMDDFDKEKAVRRYAVQLLGSFASIFLRSLAALIISAIPLVFADVSGIAPRQAVIVFLSRWDVILVATFVITAGWLVVNRSRRQR